MACRAYAQLLFRSLRTRRAVLAADGESVARVRRMAPGGVAGWGPNRVVNCGLPVEFVAVFLEGAGRNVRPDAGELHADTRAFDGGPAEANSLDS